MLRTFGYWPSTLVAYFLHSQLNCRYTLLVTRTRDMAYRSLSTNKNILVNFERSLKPSKRQRPTLRI